jgi:hypothetical protein
MKVLPEKLYFLSTDTSKSSSVSEESEEERGQKE